MVTSLPTIDVTEQQYEQLLNDIKQIFVDVIQRTVLFNRSMLTNNNVVMEAAAPKRFPVQSLTSVSDQIQPSFPSLAQLSDAIAQKSETQSEQQFEQIDISSMLLSILGEVDSLEETLDDINRQSKHIEYLIRQQRLDDRRQAISGDNDSSSSAQQPSLWSALTRQSTPNNNLNQSSPIVPPEDPITTYGHNLHTNPLSNVHTIAGRGLGIGAAAFGGPVVAAGRTINTPRRGQQQTNNQAVTIEDQLSNISQIGAIGSNSLFIGQRSNIADQVISQLTVEQPQRNIQQPEALSTPELTQQQVEIQRTLESLTPQQLEQRYSEAEAELNKITANYQSFAEMIRNGQQQYDQANQQTAFMLEDGTSITEQQIEVISKEFVKHINNQRKNLSTIQAAIEIGGVRTVADVINVDNVVNQIQPLDDHTIIASSSVVPANIAEIVGEVIEQAEIDRSNGGQTGKRLQDLLQTASTSSPVAQLTTLSQTSTVAVNGPRRGQSTPKTQTNRRGDPQPVAGDQNNNNMMQQPQRAPAPGQTKQSGGSLQTGGAEKSSPPPPVPLNPSEVSPASPTTMMYVGNRRQTPFSI